jgi:hypothetical protein
MADGGGKEHYNPWMERKASVKGPSIHRTLCINTPAVTTRAPRPKRVHPIIGKIFPRIIISTFIYPLPLSLQKESAVL